MASSYDQTLLASAPVATKAQLQDGYNPDILNEKPIAPTPPASSSRQNLEAYGTSSPPADAYKASPKQAWYRTKKGIIIIAVVLFVVIIAAAVGGAVGGSKKKKSPSGNSTSSTQSEGNGTVSGQTSNGGHNLTAVIINLD